MNEERVPFVPSATGGNWTAGVINFILRNPLYKGFPAIGKRKSEMGVFNMQDPEEWILPKKQIPELVIIEADRWDRIQLLRKSRAPKKDGGDEGQEGITPSKLSKSPLLLIGMIWCGHCGAPLTTTYNRKTYTLKTGEQRVWTSPKYRCSGKASGKPCDGKTIHSPNIVESMVLEELDMYLDQLKEMDLTAEVNKYITNNLDNDLSKIKQLEKDKLQQEKELNVLTEEVTKSLLGQSSFEPKLLNSLIAKKRGKNLMN